VVSDEITRGWAGTTLAERRDGRRRRLLDVGLELLGTEGSAAVSVRSVCRAAQLTDRYFYENFADRDALLVAVFDEVVAEFGAALVEVVGAGYPDQASLAYAAVDAFVGVMAADPRKGRVLLIEPLSSPAIGGQGLAVSPMFVELVRAQLDTDVVDETDARLAATAVVGALTSLFVRWLDGTLAVDRETLTAFCVRLLLSGAQLVE
jgi:AcrR family transcriptional regulator